MQFVNLYPRDTGTMSLPTAFSNKNYTIATSVISNEDYPKSVNIRSDFTSTGFSYVCASDGGVVTATAYSAFMIGT